MNISIFGLGYVGCVGLGCLADSGHNVIGVDVKEAKVNLINSGRATIVEKDIDKIIKSNFEQDRIRATTDSYEGVISSDVAIICVGTPNNSNGHLNMKHVYKVAKQIGKALKHKNKFFTVAIRSTVSPGTNTKVGKIISKYSNKELNKDFGVVSNPEFMREGSAVEDFYNPPYTVLASNCDKAIDKMKKVYNDINGEIIQSSIGAAELIKFVNNSYHALKVSFANEIGRICKKLGIDSHDLMNLFVKDDVLNISSYYFRPGFAYGGSCLPKDLKALNTMAHDQYLDLPILSSIDSSNNHHIDFVYDILLSKDTKNIGFYNISFKSGTDDMRFSPSLKLVERLLGKGYNVKVYDKNVNLSRIMGKNKDFLYNKLPHIQEILINKIETLKNHSDIIVITSKNSDIKDLLDFNGEIIDLVRVSKIENNLSNYFGICW